MVRVLFDPEVVRADRLPFRADSLSFRVDNSTNIFDTITLRADTLSNIFDRFTLHFDNLSTRRTILSTRTTYAGGSNYLGINSKRDCISSNYLNRWLEP